MNAPHQDLSNVQGLYKLALCIGTTLDVTKNSEVFFEKLSEHLGLKHISVWRIKSDKTLLKHSFPGDDSVPITLSSNGDLVSRIKEQEEDRLCHFSGPFEEFCPVPTSEYCIFKFEELFLIMIKDDDIESVISDDEKQLVPLLNKFLLSVRAGLSHKYLLNEIIRRQEAEDLLYEQESMYRFGANSLTEGLFVTDLENKITFANSVIKEMTGKSFGELQGQDVRTLFRSSDGGDVLPDVWKSRKKEFISPEVHLVKPNGEKFWARISASDFIGSKGGITGSIVTVLDTTESTEARLFKESRRKELRDLVENMYDALIVISEGKISKVNRAGKELLGYSDEALSNLKLSDVIHPDDYNRSKDFLELLESDGFYTGYEGRIITGDGSIKEVEVNSTAIMENGKVVGSRDIVRDITHRKELERERELSEKKLRLTIDQALDAVVTLDSEGVVLEWNMNAERIFGVLNSEAKGKKLEDLIFSDWQRKIYTRAMTNYQDTGNSSLINQRIELIGEDRYGREFPIEFSIAPIVQGKNVFYSAFIRDITERKAAEEKKASLLEELGSANQELKDFAYIVSHDLKAPLRSVGSLADWLIQDYAAVLDEEGNNLLNLLRQRIRRMHNLIEGVLQYSKLGRMQNEKELVNINELLEETIDSLDAPSSCSFIVNEEMPTVFYDRIRLQQVFQNLISNAIKFLDKPEGEIEVGMRDKGNYFVFSVRDNGPGIEDTHFQKIFQIFQTLQTRDEYESTGIGLSIVKRIVELNGGKISVESEVGVGTTFYFSVLKSK
ncbi:MAG: PAS domain-containing sensor histidine kinase [Bacteroidia bacterium]